MVDKNKFELLHTDAGSRARVGKVHTAHGVIDTPVFMPVGTLGTVKGIHQKELNEDIRARIILGNTYHLYLRPGVDVVSEAGGLHKFINWERPILTDSGGYQVFSLAHRRKIKPEGVTFQSHIDGSKHLFTPESATQIQLQLGADIIMAFDECTPYPCEYKYALNSMKLTHKWLDRCLAYFDQVESFPHGYDVTLAPIVQGSTFSDLRKQSAEYISEKGRPINAIGGLSVGEPAEEMYRITDEVTNVLPESSARYLMGVGTPANLVTCIGLGIDMFDCVLPSRNARHGLLYTWDGIINIKNERWKQDYSPIDDSSRSHTSRNHTKAYLRHLVHVGELLGAQIATLHNLSFFLELVDTAREKILDGTFVEWSKGVIPRLESRR